MVALSTRANQISSIERTKCAPLLGSYQQNKSSLCKPNQSKFSYQYTAVVFQSLVSCLTKCHGILFMLPTKTPKTRMHCTKLKKCKRLVVDQHSFFNGVPDTDNQPSRHYNFKMVQYWPSRYRKLQPSNMKDETKVDYKYTINK